MSKIKTSKAFGSGNISSYFLKLALPYINNSLVYIFNKSIEREENSLLCGKWPEILQFSKVETKVPKSIID